ncbi:glycoside hydrolase family 32 protein [Asaia krungthepensis]
MSIVEKRRERSRKNSLDTKISGRNLFSRRFFLGSSIASIAAATAQNARAAQRFPPDHVLATDPFRPITHFVAPRGWMNDPCGPIFVDGQYHLFYQWNPEAAIWDNMHWGHATSPDLVNWEYKPVALSPHHDGPERDGVFTGDVVVDGDRAVAIYTGFRFGRGQAQIQCAAYSDRSMVHWKQAHEPVLATGPDHLHIGGFRDPKLWKEGDVWVMLVGSKIEGMGGVIFRYESRNLSDWTFIRVFYGPSALRGGDDVLECPDFFDLGSCHALIFSINNVVHVISGTYNKGVFTPLREDVLGHGGFYAARSFVDQEGRRAVFGWLAEKPWQAGEAASRGWSGAMSYPRLVEADPTGKVRTVLHPAVETLIGEQMFAGRLEAPLNVAGPQVRIRLRFKARTAGSVVFAHTDRYLHLDYNPDAGQGRFSCNEDDAPLAPTDDTTLDIFVDGAVIEIFSSTGVVLNTRAYGNPSRPFTLTASGCFEGARCEIHYLLAARFTTAG